MKRLTQLLPVFLAAALQIMPLVRNLFINPAAGNTIAFILRWGIGTGATLGAFDAYSQATNFFAGPTNLTGTVNTIFTNALTLTKNTSGDGGAICTITSSALTNVIANGQTTTNGMPLGLTLKFYDLNTGSSSLSNVYCAIYGTPTKVSTNSFHLNLFYQSGVAAIDGDFTIAILAGAGSSPPNITNQPASLTNNVGSNATLSVTAGTAPLHYQWYFNTNTAEVNATNTSFTVTNVQLTNAGTYSVIITNSSGSVTSSFARLTVWQPPVITNQPVSITNLAGSSPAFSILAGGVPAVGYQWKYDTNTALTGATGTALTLTNARASQAGTYSVVITNSAGSITSAIANLVITNPLPAAFTPTAPVKSATGFHFNFTTVAGLTNTVLTNGLLVGGTWNVYTNIPPTPTPTPVVISNVLSAGNLFYRIQVVP